MNLIKKKLKIAKYKMYSEQDKIDFHKPSSGSSGSSGSSASANGNLDEDSIRNYSPFHNATRTFYITIVKYLIIALDSGLLFNNNPEKNKIKDLLSRRKSAIDSPKLRMKCLLLRSTNLAIEGFDMDASNMIREIFYNYIKEQILNGGLKEFFMNNSRMKGDKSKIFDRYFREFIQ